MDQVEARAILNEGINRLRRMSYTELTALVNKDNSYHQVMGSSGVEYNRQTLLLWDDLRQQKQKDIRVFVFVDFGSYANQIGEDFILRPDGTLIGE